MAAVEERNLAASSNNGDALIHHLLKALEVRVEDFNSEINVSQYMLPLGVSTDLTSSLKKIVENPMGHLITVRNDVDSSISSLIIHLIKHFFSLNSSIIKKAFRTETGRNDLHFSIILKNDDYESRTKIFSLIRDYKCTELWESHPITFQIIPESIANKVLAKEIYVES